MLIKNNINLENEKDFPEKNTGCMYGFLVDCERDESSLRK